MSTPDHDPTSTSPVLSPLDADGVRAALTAALDAVTAATDLDALKTARLAHAGDRSPLSLANREIGALAPSEKAVAGKLLGSTRGRLASSTGRSITVSR